MSKTPLDMPIPKLTSTHHRNTYPAISSTKPSLDKSGKTILITGGGGGIGFEIARSFAKARASRIIIIGRRKPVLDSAIVKLQNEFGVGSEKTEFVAHQGDLSDDSSISSLWETLESQKTLVDILVLNAAHVTPMGPDTLTMDKNEVMKAFEVNVGGNLLMASKFVQQHSRPQGHKLYLVNVSTAAVQMNPAPANNPYASSKGAFTALFGRIADERSVDDVQIVTFHPGAQYSEAAAAVAKKDAFNWDEFALAADFAVWAASPEAHWLHGRFVWAHWDVEELRADEKFVARLKQETDFLKVGVRGLATVSLEEFA